MVESTGGLTSGSTRPPATLPLMYVESGGALPAASGPFLLLLTDELTRRIRLPTQTGGSDI
jgi:hypothetical protein